MTDICFFFVMIRRHNGRPTLRLVQHRCYSFSCYFLAFHETHEITEWSLSVGFSSADHCLFFRLRLLCPLFPTCTIWHAHWSRHGSRFRSRRTFGISLSFPNSSKWGAQTGPGPVPCWWKRAQRGLCPLWPHHLRASLHWGRAAVAC